MKNLNTYESWLITEKNKTVEYFRAHPEALSKIAREEGIEPHHKQQYDPKKSFGGDSAQYDQQEKIHKVARMKLMKIGGETGELQVGQSVWKWSNLIIGALEGWSNWYDVRYFRVALMDSRSFEDFIEALDPKKRLWKFPGEEYNKKWEPTEEPLKPFINWVKNHWKELIDITKWLEKALTSIENLQSKKAEKEFMKLGLSMKDIEIAMTYIKEWTSMSRKKLDPKVWPLLQKISVDDSLLPPYIYRGIFIDGTKVKDPEKFKKKWYPGSKPGSSQGKATSWTIDRKTAISFMTDQDFIKDVEGGYYTLLKWKVDPKFVIADLRNLPVDHTFWNQQEIIVSPEATDYEVDTMIPGSEGLEAFKKFSQENPGGQGGWGKTKASFAQDFMNTPYETLSPGMRIEMKQVAKMTVGEFQKAYPTARINADNPDFLKMPMPIFNYLQRYTTRWDVTSTNDREVKFKIMWDLNWLDYSNNPNIKSTYKKYKDEFDFNQFAGVLKLVSNEGIIKLIDDDYYDMDLEISLPTKFNLEKVKDEKPNSLDNEADMVFRKIFDELGSEEFVNSVKMSQQEILNKLPKNINMKIK